jgi:hypothetical protein
MAQYVTKDVVKANNMPYEERVKRKSPSSAGKSDLGPRKTGPNAPSKTSYRLNLFYRQCGMVCMPSAGISRSSYEILMRTVFVSKKLSSEHVGSPSRPEPEDL